MVGVTGSIPVVPTTFVRFASFGWASQLRGEANEGCRAEAVGEGGL
jgi:hypothetical protein